MDVRQTYILLNDVPFYIYLASLGFTWLSNKFITIALLILSLANINLVWDFLA
jgi:hypothetical protein